MSNFDKVDPALCLPSAHSFLQCKVEPGYWYLELRFFIADYLQGAVHANAVRGGLF